MNQVESIAPYLEPIRKSISVGGSPGSAFDLFTSGIANWWPTEVYSCSKERVHDVIVEPRVGGAVYEVRDDGETFAWGQILVWEPSQRFVMTWHPGREPSTAQEVEIRFVETAKGTRVELEHRGWRALGAEAPAMRKRYVPGWDFVLAQCFGEACEAHFSQPGE